MNPVAAYEEGYFFACDSPPPPPPPKKKKKKKKKRKKKNDTRFLLRLTAKKFNKSGLSTKDLEPEISWNMCLHFGKKKKKSRFSKFGSLITFNDLDITQTKENYGSNLRHDSLLYGLHLDGLSMDLCGDRSANIRNMRWKYSRQLFSRCV